jgi:hypothetical protein
VRVYKLLVGDFELPAEGCDLFVAARAGCLDGLIGHSCLKYDSFPAMPFLSYEGEKSWQWQASAPATAARVPD